MSELTKYTINENWYWKLNIIISGRSKLILCKSFIHIACGIYKHGGLFLSLDHLTPKGMIVRYCHHFASIRFYISIFSATIWLIETRLGRIVHCMDLYKVFFSIENPLQKQEATGARLIRHISTKNWFENILIWNHLFI